MVDGPNTGNRLASDLKQLLIVAHSHLPSMATAFEKAADQVATTSADDDGVFAGEVGPAWQRLRNEYQRLLSQSQANMQDCATALVQCVNAYAEQDARAATQLRDLIEQEGKYYGISLPARGDDWESPEFTDPQRTTEIDEPSAPPEFAERPPVYDPPDEEKHPPMV